MPCQCHFPVSTEPLSVIICQIFVTQCCFMDFIPKLLLASCKRVKISYLMHLGGIYKNGIQ